MTDFSERATVFDSYTSDTATEDSLGLVQPDGTTITIESGVITAVSSETTVDIATTSSVGTVMPDGSSITISEDGVITAEDQGTSVDIATTSDVGTVKPDGTTITIDDEGSITAVSSSIVEAFLEEVVSTDSVVTVTLSSDETALADLTLLRSGNIVQFVWMDVIDLSGYDEGTQVFTLPSGFTPAVDAEYLVTLTSDSEAGNGVFNIDTSGNVLIWGCNSSNEYYMVTGTFITTDSYSE